MLRHGFLPSLAKMPQALAQGAGKLLLFWVLQPSALVKRQLCPVRDTQQLAYQAGSWDWGSTPNPSRAPGPYAPGAVGAAAPLVWLCDAARAGPRERALRACAAQPGSSWLPAEL